MGENVITRLMWVLPPGAAHMQSSAQLQPPTDIYIYKAACPAVRITKKSMNPLLRLDVLQVVQKVACATLRYCRENSFSLFKTYYLEKHYCWH